MKTQGQFQKEGEVGGIEGLKTCLIFTWAKLMGCEETGQ